MDSNEDKVKQGATLWDEMREKWPGEADVLWTGEGTHGSK
jgi:hypothetical protein